MQETCQNLKCIPEYASREKATSFYDRRFCRLQVQSEAAQRPSRRCEVCNVHLRSPQDLRFEQVEHPELEETVHRILLHCPFGHDNHVGYINQKIVQRKEALDELEQRIQAGEEIEWKEVRRTAKKYTVYYRRFQEKMARLLGEDVDDG